MFTVFRGGSPGVLDILKFTCVYFTCVPVFTFYYVVFLLCFEGSTTIFTVQLVLVLPFWLAYSPCMLHGGAQLV